MSASASPFQTVCILELLLKRIWGLWLDNDTWYFYYYPFETQEISEVLPNAFSFSAPLAKHSPLMMQNLSDSLLKNPIWGETSFNFTIHLWPIGVSIWLMLVVYLEYSMAQPLSNSEPFVDITNFPAFQEKLRKTPLQVCNPIVPINWNHIQNQFQKETQFNQVSHKKKIGYFPLNPGYYVGIQISMVLWNHAHMTG